MATKIPRVIADLELQLATALSVAGTSFTLSSANDDDGEALPAGIYVFAVDSGTSNKEYLLGQLNDNEVTAVQSVSRQGVQTSGAARAHRVGAPVILTNFAALQLVSDTLRGAIDLDGASPLSYDTLPTLSDDKELATVGYVLAIATGGDVSFDKQTIAGTAGATIVAGNLVYFQESDQEWYLCDGETAATLDGVMRGIALGGGSDGVAITGGVHLAGAWTTTGLTAGSIYYASDTDGAIATSAGTVKHIVGVALSTTRLWVIPQHRETIPTRTKDALSGGGDLGTPSTSNKFLTEDWETANSGETGNSILVKTKSDGKLDQTVQKSFGSLTTITSFTGAGSGNRTADEDMIVTAVNVQSGASGSGDSNVTLNGIVAGVTVATNTGNRYNVSVTFAVPKGAVYSVTKNTSSFAGTQTTTVRAIKHS